MSLLDKEGFIWIDGEFVPWKEANVHILTHSLHYGSGIFEGIKAYAADQGTAIFRLQDHTDRLFRSAHLMQIKISYEKELLNKIQLEILKKNNLKTAYIRPLVFYGATYLGLYVGDLPVHTMIAAWEWGSYFHTENADKGIKAQTSSYTRNSIKSTFCKAKACGNYINSVLALREARAHGYEEALMLDHHGFVSEGSSSNIFVVRNEILYTPTTTSILEGITRDTVLTLAKDLGLETQEKNLTRDDIYVADEIFSTGTAAEITAITEVDGRKIGQGIRGHITKQLQNSFTEVLHGRNDKYLHWLSFV